METKLRLIMEMAAKDRKCKFSNLIHLLNVTNLRDCLCQLKRDKATEIDGVSFSEYEINLETNLIELVARMKQYSYRPAGGASDIHTESEWQVADIKGFFDNVDHQWLMRCLEERTGDKGLLRYIKRFLKAGVMEEGK